MFCQLEGEEPGTNSLGKSGKEKRAKEHFRQMFFLPVIRFFAWSNYLPTSHQATKHGKELIFDFLIFCTVKYLSSSLVPKEGSLGHLYYTNSYVKESEWREVCPREADGVVIDVLRSHCKGSSHLRENLSKVKVVP